MSSSMTVFKGTSNEYEICVGSGLLNDIGAMCRRLGLGRRVLVVTNEDVAPHYLTTVVDSLCAAEFDVYSAVIAPGEEEKSWHRAGALLDQCVDARLERTSFVVALGGGVVGDLAGFVAAVYMRGIPFVQVPTTLLAQVDASVGGKVAVNHPLGKNLLGSFHQPALVVSDLQTLHTLPDRELQAGMAEVVKHGLIRDPALYGFVAERPGAFVARDAAALQRVVIDSCRLKADIVQQDEKEHGVRAILNFGHTVGHAIEAAAGYGTYTHGEAIAIGMVAEAMLSIDYGDVSEADVAELRTLLHALSLPTTVPSELGRSALDYLMRDKKVQHGRLRFALLRRVGWAEVTDSVGPDAVAAVLQQLEHDEAQ